LDEQGRASLTAFEIAGLNALCNLADGHAKLIPSVQPFELDSLVALAMKPPSSYETSFLDVFGSTADKEYDPTNVVLFPSASAAIDTIAKFVVAEGRTHIALLQPTFDNIALLFARAGATVSPVGEGPNEILEACRWNNVVFLVSPNNPTGWRPTVGLWEDLGKLSLKHDVILIIDRTFRFLTQRDRGLDSLAAGNPMVVTIYDTGKTWSTLECKVSFIHTCPGERLEAIREIAEEITLNVSPLHLDFCTSTIRREQGAERLLSAIRHNRKLLMPALEAYGFKVCGAPLSFIVVEAPKSLCSSDIDMVETLAQDGLATLPMSRFFWADPNRPSRQLRLSLARPPYLVRRATDILRRKGLGQDH